MQARYINPHICIFIILFQLSKNLSRIEAIELRVVFASVVAVIRPTKEASFTKDFLVISSRLCQYNRG